MSAAPGQSCHPRRRPLKGHVSHLSTHGMTLRKSGTFSSPKSASTDLCGLDNSPFMPRRSPTSPESLEALLQQDPSVRRVADLLKDFDQKIAGHKAASAKGASLLTDPEVLPVPSFVLDSTALDVTPMDIDPKPVTATRTPHDHASDSGLGSSIAEFKDDDLLAHSASTCGSVSTSITSTYSAVTRSASGVCASEDKHTLGEYACRHIHDLIIKPILAEDTLKEFHPLIKDVPRRIGDKSICNLRDLEKTLIFLAPELSITANSYLRFCERSIQLLHTTVEYLSDQDQRLPTDRPYTNNYFLDLIEQIRRYAAIMAATRQKESNGEELDELDYSRDEKISLRGGLSHNGRPMELVREKDGKVLPISEEAEGGYKIPKRAYADDEMDDDEAMRSMARRRKSDKPGDVMHACRDCKKEFKRPCDLTKHEKTHSRPWKCTEEKCKYYELGWPTEKERDRHMNDKHSAAPAQFKCLYPPCSYASKRESNCKQHMEKAHGWEYVRSKSNGRKKAPTGTDRSPTTPLTPFISTPLSATLTSPATPFAPSPHVPTIDTFDYYGFGTPALSVQGFQDDFRRDSVTTDGSHFTYSTGHSPTEPTSFDDAVVTPEDTTINHNDVFGNCGFDTNFTTVYQQPTPALSTNFTFDTNPFATSASFGNIVPHLSPLAQPDVTLYSPQAPVDEGFVDTDMQDFMTGGAVDFTLFDPAQPSMGSTNMAPLFPDFNQVGGQFDPLYSTPSNNNFDEFMGNNFSS